MATKKKKKTLGRDMLKLYDELGDLIQATDDPTRKADLTTQQDALWDEIARLVESALDADDVKYKAAAAGMADAIAEVRDALKGLQSVVNAVKFAAKAVELAAKVIAV